MKWKWDYEAFDAVLCGPEMQALMGSLVEKGKEAAVLMAPETTGHYKRSFETEVSVGSPAPDGGRRAYGKLRNTADYAASVEYGNKTFQAHHVLGKAVDFMRE